MGRCPTPWQGEVLPAPPARPMDVPTERRGRKQRLCSYVQWLASRALVARSVLRSLFSVLRGAKRPFPAPPARLRRAKGQRGSRSSAKTMGGRERSAGVQPAKRPALAHLASRALASLRKRETRHLHSGFARRPAGAFCSPFSGVRSAPPVFFFLFSGAACRPLCYNNRHETRP